MRQCRSKTVDCLVFTDDLVNYDSYCHQPVSMFMRIFLGRVCARRGQDFENVGFSGLPLFGVLEGSRGECS